MSETAEKVEAGVEDRAVNQALDISAIRRRLQRATPGPWIVEYGPHGKIQNSAVVTPNHTLTCGRGSLALNDVHSGNQKIATVWNVSCTCIQGKQYDNQEFIAHAITDIPLLIEEIQRLRRLLDTRQGSDH